MNDPVEIRHEHLINLVMKNVAVPGHAVGHHDEGGAVLDQMPGQQCVQAKCSRSVSLLVAGRELFQIEEVGAAHESLHPLEHGIVGTGGFALALVLVFSAEEPSQRLALLM